MKNQKIQRIISEIVEKIEQQLKPRKIILFGSYAHGKPNRDSDIDILIVTEKPLAMEKTFQLKHSLLKNNSMPVQIITIPLEEFLETKEIIGGIAYPASKYGKTLYERP